MLRDPGHILTRASRGEHGCGQTPAQRRRVEEDRRFGALKKYEVRSKKGVNGMSDMEGKVARVTASECGQRVSFN